MKILNRLYARFSPKQLFTHWRSRQSTEHLLCSIDETELKALLKYKEQTGHSQYRKYFNAPYWLRKNVARAVYLNLHRSKSLNILDIGSGFGYFPYAAKFYGHDVLGIDLPGDILFNKASEFLGVIRQEYTIEPMTPMPYFGKKFDLVTAFQVCFNGHIENKIWQKKEWNFFLQDLFANHVAEGGRLYMELNWSPHVNGWLPQEVISLFKEKYNAKFDDSSRVTLYAPSSILQADAPSKLGEG